MGTFTVKIFGMLAEKLDHQEVELPFCKDTDELKEKFFHLYPDLKDFSFSIALNKRLMHDCSPLTGKEDIAFLPPFSGG